MDASEVVSAEEEGETLLLLLLARPSRGLSLSEPRLSDLAANRTRHQEIRAEME